MHIIDVDSHFIVNKGLDGSPLRIEILPDGGHLIEFSRAQLDIAPPQGKVPRPGKPALDVRTYWDLDRRLDDLDREGINQQVLIFHTSHLFYGADAQVAVQTARKFNDGVAEMISSCRAPGRYLGAVHLPLQDPQAAADEAERAIKELHMPAVVIGTNVQGKNLDLPEFWPFFARMNDLQAPIIVHSDGLSPFQTHIAAGERLGWTERSPFAGDYPVWWMLGHPFEHMIAIARIIYSGLLDRYPNLRFIFEEGNVGYAIYLFDRLESGWEFGEQLFGPRVHLKPPKKRPLEYLEHFHWAVESEDSMIGEVIKRWGADRILFSTDYPHPDSPWPDSVKEMREAITFCSAEDQAKVLGGNATRLLRM